jgi:alanyl-tRNA synthetase
MVRLGEKTTSGPWAIPAPAGPVREIHIDRGEALPATIPIAGWICDCDRFLEIWNLVFMQYQRDAAGNLNPLPKPSIDTGMGLERIAAVAQGKHNNYDSDLFQPIIARACELAGVKYGPDSRTNTALRVIADHARATTFLVADGVLPSNEGRGYVLRRIMRRAIRYGRNIGLARPFLHQHRAESVFDHAAGLSRAGRIRALHPQRDSSTKNSGSWRPWIPGSGC